MPKTARIRPNRSTTLMALALFVALTFAAPAWSVDYIVVNFDDSGVGSLRWAIQESNRTPAIADRILISSSLSPDIQGQIVFEPTRDLPPIIDVVTIQDEDFDNRDVLIRIVLANSDPDPDETNGFAINSNTTLVNTVLQGSEITLGSGVKLTNDVDNGVLAEYSSWISGQGSFDKDGTSTLVIGGVATFVGGTNVNAGVLRGDTNSLQGNVSIDAGAVLEFQHPLEYQTFNPFIPGDNVIAPDPVDSGTFVGATSGAGTVVKTGDGKLIVNDSSSTLGHTGGTYVLGGTLEGDAASLASEIFVCGSGDSFAGTAPTGYDCQGGTTATLIYRETANAVVLSGELHGSGDLRKKGSGSLNINASSATALADFFGKIYVDNGTFGVFFRPPNDNDFEVSGQLQVSFTVIAGELEIKPGGEVILFSAGTLLETVSNNPVDVYGTLNVMAGGIVNRDVIVRSGGTLTGTNPALLAKNVTIETGGFLTGSGSTISDVFSDGTIEPSGFDAITIVGSAELYSNSQYNAHVEPGGASNMLDLTTPGETATIDALTVDIQFDDGDFGNNEVFTIIRADEIFVDVNDITVSERSDRLWSNFVANVVDDCTATQDCLDVEVAIAKSAPLASAAQTPNQRNVAEALDFIGDIECPTIDGCSDPDFEEAYLGLGLGTPINSLDEAYSQLDGDEYANWIDVRNAGAVRYNASISRRFDLEANMTLPGTRNRFATLASSFDSPFAMASMAAVAGADLAMVSMAADGMLSRSIGLGRHPGQGGWTMWADMHGIFGGLDSPTTDDIDYQVYGPLFGFDYGLTDNFAIGATLGYNRDQMQTDNDFSKSTANTYQGGLYAGYLSNRGYVTVSGRYAYSDIESRRHIRYGDPTRVDRIAHGDFDGDEISAFLEAAYTFHPLEGMKLQPVVNVAYNHIGQDGFRESDAGSLDLAVSDMDVDIVTSNIGLRLGMVEETLETLYIHPQIRVAWERDWTGSSRNLSMSLESSGTVGRFSVEGARIPKDRAVVGISTEAGLTESFSLFLDYDCRVAKDYLENTVAVGFRAIFW